MADDNPTKIPEMVERVARRMHAKHFEFAVPDDSGHPGLFYFREMARVALQAMREPTEAMLAAVPAGTCFTCNRDWYSGPQEIWQSMIDAALGE